jgi:microcystin-dependent protein
MSGINLPDLDLGLKQVNVGITPDDGLGDNIRVAFQKFNQNMNIISGCALENVTTIKNVYVSQTTGLDTNSGLTDVLPFQTIQKAINYIYTRLLTKDHVAIINLLPGSYTESVVISGRPLGARNTDIDLIIRKYPIQPGTVNWNFNSTLNNEAIKLSTNARVSLKDISFSSPNLTVAQVQKSFINAQDNSLVKIDNLTFNELGSFSVDNSSHIYLDHSFMSIEGDYQIEGGTSAHILANESSYVFVSAAFADVTASNPVVLKRLVECYEGSYVNFPSSKITYTGAISGRAFVSDFFSRIDFIGYPSGMTVGTYKDLVVKPIVNFVSSIRAQAGSITDGPATFNNTSNFIGSSRFGSALSLEGITDVVGTLNVPTLNVTEATTKAASTSFVQNVVQTKIVEALPIATNTLFGIVKINEASNDPVVYIRPAVDTLLNLKANIESPLLTGDPRAPTRATIDNSTSIATTQFVKSVISEQSFIPAGVILPYAGGTIPPGFLLCNGSTVLRASQVALFAAIGTMHGTTDINNFLLPDYRDVSLIGALPGTKELGSGGGAHSVVITPSQMPRHTHTIADTGHTHTITDPGHSHSVFDSGHHHEVLGCTQGDGFTDNLNHPSASIAGEIINNARGYMATNGSGQRLVQISTSNVSIFGAVTNVSAQTSSSGITVNLTGNDAALNITPKYKAVHFMIKT